MIYFLSFLPLFFKQTIPTKNNCPLGVDNFIICVPYIVYKILAMYFLILCGNRVCFPAQFPAQFPANTNGLQLCNVECKSNANCMLGSCKLMGYSCICDCDCDCNSNVGSAGIMESAMRRYLGSDCDKKLAIIVIFPQGQLYHLATSYCGKITCGVRESWRVLGKGSLGSEASAGNC